MRKIQLLVLAASILLTACQASATVEPDNPLDPGNSLENSLTELPIFVDPTKEQPNMPNDPLSNDGNLSREGIFIEEMGLIIRESFPPQIALSFSGNLPTPCHEIRSVVSDPDADNKINIEVYTLVDPNIMCTQVLKPFTESIELGTFPSGHYSVWINGQLAGEFDS